MRCAVFSEVLSDSSLSASVTRIPVSHYSVCQARSFKVGIARLHFHMPDHALDVFGAAQVQGVEQREASDWNEQLEFLEVLIDWRTRLSYTVEALACV